MVEKKELKDLKAGDKVVYNHGYTKTISIKTIDKITPKGLIKIGNLFFSSIDGWQRNTSSCYLSWINVATEKEMAEITEKNWRQQAVKKIRETSYHDVSIKGLKELLAMIEVLKNGGQTK